MEGIIRILVADDTDIAREGVRRLLAAEGDIEVIGEGASISETVQKVRELHPDVLLLDLKWFTDEKAGIEAIRRLTSEVPETKIIAITVYPHLIEMAKTAGVVAAIPKEISRQQLVNEIRAVHRLPPPPASPTPKTSVEKLTERELEVLTLMAEGKTDKEIATALSIAESTAKNHVSHILGKLNVSNRAGAVALAYELRLLNTE
jgi:DNA-binding NarL/FixJ family response regulator